MQIQISDENESCGGTVTISENGEYVISPSIDGGENCCDNCKQNKWATANMKTGHCSTKAGCYNGQCWAYCGPYFSRGPWCYTTKVEPQSKQYVKCTDDSECNPCWACAGDCGV